MPPKRWTPVQNPASGGLLAHLGDAQRLRIEGVEERPAVDDQAKTADADGRPEGALGRNALQPFGDLLETQARFLLDVLRRRFQNRLRYDNATGQGGLLGKNIRSRDHHLQALTGPGPAPRTRRAGPGSLHSPPLYPRAAD